MEPATLSEALRAKRAIDRLSFDDAAKRCGAARNTFKRWAIGQGIDSITFAHVVKIAAWLEISYQQVIELGRADCPWLDAGAIRTSGPTTDASHLPRLVTR